MKNVLATGLALCMALVTAGCGPQIGSEGRIGVIYLNAEGYYAGVQRGLTAGFEDSEREPQLIQTNIQSDASRESTFVDTISSVQADALILSPASATASIPAIELAHESGVPVICYNTCVTDEATEEFVSAYILGDPTEFGAASGRQMAQYFLDEGIEEPKVAIVNCEQFEVCIQRREGFEAALLEQVPGATIVANQEGLTLDEAVERAEQIITAHPDVDAFYGEAGSQMLGAVRAVRARGLTGETVVFGGDMSTQAAQMLADNTILKGVTDISGIKVGDLAAEVTLQILAGSEPDDVIVPAPIDEYATAESGLEWIETHPDGIP
ncbi:substrate-binding domain-containing protein [Sediminivirga luteola]|uniref:Sugar ABC transporter substrate-binding protein n=1 Tax=Sediminivirga luteola TaxID=1774748 RepID=A0A8J2TW30_9MICO|nr:substrate-binding domain-containing protein [Sediminivirga luteola]MCI2264421.1 substrate-binding domain-containing protein [Sediminivirga luteola]GGA06065.1 sugar ABC transporter substrate-binding protein [Sediminivirga luteola]